METASETENKITVVDKRKMLVDTVNKGITIAGISQIVFAGLTFVSKEKKGTALGWFAAGVVVTLCAQTMLRK